MRFIIFLVLLVHVLCIESDSDETEEKDNNVLGMEDLPYAFSNRRSFSCPRMKSVLHTGDSAANLSPEDIDVVAALGDSLASGRGLWPPTDVDFRGAAFPIGGDANIDGLVTLPNILLEFNEALEGVSHGMGTRDRLPDYQFNVAVSGSETEDLPEQAEELVRRLKSNVNFLPNKWVMITISTGTEEFCLRCDTPDHSSLRKALGTLRKAVPKALVVLLGPVHVASSYSLNINLLKTRCKCLESVSKNRYLKIVREWKSVLFDVQDEFNNLNYLTFAVLAIPQLTIHSRDPDSLFVVDQPLLNRKGHTYAAKWLWNRLISGPNYNISEAIFSQDAYYCPALKCPYFRTVQNQQNCSIISQERWIQMQLTTLPPGVTTRVPHREKVRQNLVGIVVLVVVLAFFSVSSFGTFFYCRGLHEHRSFVAPKNSDEAAPLPEPK